MYVYFTPLFPETIPKKMGEPQKNGRPYGLWLDTLGSLFLSQSRRRLRVSPRPPDRDLQAGGMVLIRRPTCWPSHYSTRYLLRGKDLQPQVPRGAKARCSCLARKFLESVARHGGESILKNTLSSLRFFFGVSKNSQLPFLASFLV